MNSMFVGSLDIARGFNTMYNTRTKTLMSNQLCNY